MNRVRPLGPKLSHGIVSLGENSNGLDHPCLKTVGENRVTCGTLTSSPVGRRSSGQGLELPLMHAD